MFEYCTITISGDIMRFLALSVLFVSFSTMAACPNLAGTYTTCTSATGNVSGGTTVTQSTVGTVTTYEVTSKDEDMGTEVTETIIADGKARSASQTDEDTGVVITVSTKASCMAGALMYEASVVAQGQTFANVVTHVTKNGSQLMTHTTGESMGTAINETEVCQ
jgi:hypothetical protein